MASLERKPGGGTAHWDEICAALAVPLSGAGCTCGAAEQLEGARAWVASQHSSIASRGESLQQREGELELRALRHGDGLQELQAATRDFMLRRAEAEAPEGELAEVDALLRAASQRELALHRCEGELAAQVARLEELERDVQARELEARGGEAALLEERNCIEDACAPVGAEHARLKAKAVGLDRERAAVSAKLREVEQERETLLADELLLAEIEGQIEPIRRSLAARELRLATDEADVGTHEAEREKGEAALLHEQASCDAQLHQLEDRARELRSRKEESEQQLQRVLSRQRDLGGAEIRLHGLEGALRSHAVAERTAEDSRSGSATAAPEEAQMRLAKLRRADAVWGVRVHAQEAEIRELEARVEELETAKGCTTGERSTAWGASARKGSANRLLGSKLLGAT